MPFSLQLPSIRTTTCHHMPSHLLVKWNNGPIQIGQCTADSGYFVNCGNSFSIIDKQIVNWHCDTKLNNWMRIRCCELVGQ